MEDWIGLYKIGRLGLMACLLVGIAIYLFTGSRKQRLEEPARRMLEDDDAPGEQNR